MKFYKENGASVVVGEDNIPYVGPVKCYVNSTNLRITDDKNKNLADAAFASFTDKAGGTIGNTEALVLEYCTTNAVFKKAGTAVSVSGVGNEVLIYSNSLKTGDITAGDLSAGSTGGANVAGFNITANGLQILNTTAAKVSAGGVYPSSSGVTFVKLLPLKRTSLNRFRVKYKVVFGGTVDALRRYCGFGQLGEGVKTPQNGGWLTTASTGASRSFEYFNENQTVFTNSATPTTVIEVEAVQWDKQVFITSKVDGVLQPLYKGAAAMEIDAKGRTPGHWAFYALGGDVLSVSDLEIWDLSGTCSTMFLGNSILDQWGLYTGSGQWNVVNQLQQHTPAFLENYARSASIARDFIQCAEEIARKTTKRVIFPFGANEIGGNLVTPAQAVIDHEDLANAILAEKSSLEIVVWLMPCAFNVSAKPFNDAITAWANMRGFQTVPVWQVVQATDNSTTMFNLYANDSPATHLGFIGQKAIADFVVANYLNTIQ